MVVWKTQKASISERSLPIPIEVQTTPKTEHLDSLIRNQLFMATSHSNTHEEVCARHLANHKRCYSVATKQKG